MPVLTSADGGVLSGFLVPADYSPLEQAASGASRSMTETGPPRYWFPAKRYGWGWGLPSTWEGRTVLGVYLALLVVLGVFVPAERHPHWFWCGFSTLIASLIAICWWKGEPPRWRWG